jgi:multicomponent Na+:H+ antiporter subunit D
MAGSPDKTIDLSAAQVIEPVATGDFLVIAPIVITILGGALCLMMRKNTDRQPWVAIPTLLLLVASTFGLFMRILETGHPITMTMGKWLPPFGISFSADVFGASFALIASVIALLAGIYAIADISATNRRYGFYPFLLLMMTGVCGAFLTGDIFNLYVWFEVLLISSFGLIVLGSRPRQLDGAFKYAILNLIATTLFLLATGYLYGVMGTLNMADIAQISRRGDLAGPINTIGALYVLAFMMKAAAFPVNFWLPASYHTPRIVVSAVFAGLLTKVGIYALIRTSVMLLPASQTSSASLLLWLAVGTMIFGVLGALAQSDVRRILGYLVVSGIGSMLVGIALTDVLGLAGATFYAFHSMVVMTALYLAIGLLAHNSGGAFRLQELGGEYQRSPLFAGVFLVLVFAVSGLPPFTGFWPKLMLTHAALGAGQWWIAGAILITGFLTTVVMGRVWVMAFWRGGPAETPDGTHVELAPDRRTDWVRLLPILALTAMLVGYGVAPDFLMELVSFTARSLMEPSAYIGSVFGAPQ